MKRYWEYMKEFQEKVDHAKDSEWIINPELWIGFKFLDDNGIENPWEPNEKARLEKVLDRYNYAERTLFVRAIKGTFEVADEY